MRQGSDNERKVAKADLPVHSPGDVPQLPPQRGDAGSGRSLRAGRRAETAVSKCPGTEFQPLYQHSSYDLTASCCAF